MRVIISGRVIRGSGYGKQLGFPTANLDRRGWRKKLRGVRNGVYAGFVELAQVKDKARPTERFQSFGRGLRIKDSPCVYKAGIVIGPKDERGLPKIEAHLIGFSGNLYGKKLVLTLEKYLRSFISFQNEQSLRTQIRKDLANVRHQSL